MFRTILYVILALLVVFVLISVLACVLKTNQKPNNSRKLKFAGVLDSERKNIFTNIYEQKAWGSDNQKFYSGAGSHFKHNVKPYVDAILNNKLIKNLDCVDLGCGDFNIGSQIRSHFKRYTACDIVAPLIAHNKEKFKNLDVTFLTLDGVQEPLPKGDVISIRQVLQHLSNNDIQSIVLKLPYFKYAVITEHLPLDPDFVPNLDKPSDSLIRLSFNSGVVLHKKPFNLKYYKKFIIAKANDDGGVIQTTLYQMQK